ncbi:MAG: hypothetical protein ACD_75C00833G0002 [uncultured bacterium]|nr:MAG: hypothetical protein ACD_75C00833G0002 [uncultured bacterium]
MTPVLFKPAPIIMTAMIDTTALELSPAIASSAVITPVRGKRTIIRRPTRSTRNRSVTKRKIARLSRKKTIIMSVVITIFSMAELQCKNNLNLATPQVQHHSSKIPFST